MPHMAQDAVSQGMSNSCHHTGLGTYILVSFENKDARPQQSVVGTGCRLAANQTIVG